MTAQRINVMHVIDTLAVGGAERMLVDIANNLDRDKFNVFVCVTRNTCTLSSELREGIPFRALKRGSRYNLKGFVSLKQFVSEQNVDIFHAHGRSTYSFLLAASLLGFIKKPIILHDHYGSLHVDTRVPAWFKLVGARKLSHYIGVCEGLGAWAHKAGVPEQKISIIGNGLDLTRFEQVNALDLHSLLDIPLDKPIGISVGTIRSDKGLDLLIEACSNFRKEQMPYFVIIGKDNNDIYPDSCRRQLQTAGLSEFFRFAGAQQNALNWIKGADFAVMAARSESGPLVLIEYLMCGLPFAAFNVGWVSELINQHLPQQFASPLDTEDLFQHIQNVLHLTEAKKLEQAVNGKNLAKRLFDINDRIPAFSLIYNGILRKTS